jgi:hypothetical protein
MLNYLTGEDPARRRNTCPQYVSRVDGRKKNINNRSIITQVLSACFPEAVLKTLPISWSSLMIIYKM